MGLSLIIFFHDRMLTEKAFSFQYLVEGDKRPSDLT